MRGTGSRVRHLHTEQGNDGRPGCRPFLNLVDAARPRAARTVRVRPHATLGQAEELHKPSLVFNFTTGRVGLDPQEAGRLVSTVGADPAAGGTRTAAHTPFSIRSSRPFPAGRRARGGWAGRRCGQDRPAEPGTPGPVYSSQPGRPGGDANSPRSPAGPGWVATSRAGMPAPPERPPGADGVRAATGAAPGGRGGRGECDGDQARCDGRVSDDQAVERREEVGQGHGRASCANRAT